MTRTVTEIDGLLINSCGPVRGTFLPTPRGLSVLYGINGAGKSHLLRSLAACLTGEPRQRQQTSLAVRVPERSDTEKLPLWLHQYLSNWSDRSEKHWAWGSAEGAVIMTANPDELARRAATEALECAGPSYDDEQDQFDRAGVTRDQVAAEIVLHGIYLLGEPLSSQERPVHMGAVLDDRTLTLGRALRADLAMRDGPDAFADPTFADLRGGEFPALRDPAQHPAPVFAQLYYSEKTVNFGALADVIVGDTPIASVSQLLRSLEDLGVTLAEDASSDAGIEAFEILSGIEVHAQELLDLVLLDAPRLRLHRGGLREWLVHEAPDWRIGLYQAKLPRRDFDRTLDELSEAQTKWVNLAINTAVAVALRNLMPAPSRAHMRQSSAINGGELFILIDEPEAHLHRSAEAHMAHGLSSWADLLKAHIIVASHSPELLDHTESQLLHVARPSRGEMSAIRPLTSPTLHTMNEFGLHASDLLRRQRGFLLVEGLHDQIVLEVLIGDALRAARIDILPLRGAKQLPATVDSQFLFDFTDATIIVMLDAIEAGDIALVWDRARALAAGGNTAAAGEELRSALAGNSAELRWMREFLSKSLERQVHDRLIPFGLQARDVVEYLPVGLLVPKSGSWSELRAEHEKSGSKKDFKHWLSLAKRADFTAESIRASAQTMDRVPDELVDLANICVTLGARLPQKPPT